MAEPTFLPVSRATLRCVPLFLFSSDHMGVLGLSLDFTPCHTLEKVLGISPGKKN